jgi:hypothetical protein
MLKKINFVLILILLQPLQFDYHYVLIIEKDPQIVKESIKITTQDSQHQLYYL